VDRPAGVPDTAAFDEATGVYELGPMKAGVKHGSFTTWRSNGTKKAELRYKDGKLHGPFRFFLESGELFREGTYRNGEFHGLLVVYRLPDSPDDDVLESVAESVVKSELEYASGRLVAVRHFDGEKNRVAANGDAFPELPRGVPSLAAFEAGQRRWVHGPVDGEGRRTGLWMWWADDGTLIEESEFRDGKRDGVCRRYSATGVLVEEGSFADDAMNGTWSFFDASDGVLERKADYDDGKFHGSVVDFGKDGRSRTRVEYDNGKKTGQYLARADKGKYAGGQIRVENGQYVDDVQVGRWKLLDKSLNTIATIDFGVPRSENDITASPALDDAPRDDAMWRELADKLKEDRKIGESILASARAAAESRDATVLKVRLDEETAPLSKKWSSDLVDEVTMQGSARLAPIVHALVGGGNAPRVLEALASALERARHTHAALDFVNAALLLDEQRTSLVSMRGNIHVRLGEADRARQDAALLRESDEERARALECTIAALFPRFDFWPASFSPEKAAKKRALALVRDLSSIQLMIQKYATRYETLRRRALTHVDGIMPWAPPDASPLLPIGDVHLVRGTVTIDGATVDVDEDIPSDDGDLPTLLAWLRGSFAALCWLCWACGADRPTLSRTLRVPRDLSAIANLMMERAEALTADVVLARFSFCDMPVDELPDVVRDVARVEYAEVAATFAWLTDPSVPSPFVASRRPAPPRISW